MNAHMNTVAELAQAALKGSASKDRESWLALWADDAVIEDPVGTDEFARPGRRFAGIAAITDFWDSMIAWNADLRYEIERCYPAGDELALAIHFQIVKGAEVSGLHALNVYKRSPNGKLASMRSFWDETFRLPL
jgi:steroid Delta-isomerase